MTTKKKRLTAEDLLNLPDDGHYYELEDGELVELTPPNPEHGFVSGNIAGPVQGHVKAARLGFVLINDPGIIVRRDPDTVRGPDICFFAAGRFPEGRPPSFYTDISPDFVVEVASPSDSAAYMRRRVEQWRVAGVRLVWAVFPRTRSVAVYRGLGDVRVYQEGEVLDGTPVLPEFTLPVAEAFS